MSLTPDHATVPNGFDEKIILCWHKRYDTQIIAAMLDVAGSTVYNRLAAIREAARARKKAHDAVRVWI